MFNNSKYGNTLTIILIISIIAFLGIVGIIGVRMYNAYYIDTGATQVATQFEQSLQNNIANNIITGQENILQNEINTNKVDISGIGENVIDNSIDISNGNNNSNNSNGNTSKPTNITYKGYNVVGTIEIPSIKLKYPILEKLTAKSLKVSVVLLYTAQGLNNPGNTVIIGHNYRNGTMFSNVDKLKNGDIINITDNTGKKVKYKIYNIFRASGSESEYITRNTGGKREISLSTCTDDSKARTIVLAKEV